MTELKIKRIYDTPSKDDGIRILVDRLWPRGISKEKAHLDYWLKDIAPGTELREWFDHKPERFKEFSKNYREELKGKNDLINEIENFLKKHNVTLLYAAKDPEINHAIVLEDTIQRRL